MTGTTITSTNTTTDLFNITTSVYDTFGYYIHPHWKQFAVVPDEWHYIIGIYITLVGITGIIGNSIVIWIFSTTVNLKTPSNLLIINLALSDLVFSAVNGFPLLTISAFNRKWMWGDTACQLYGFIGGLFGLMSINSLAAISVDRYYNIAEPLKAAQFMTKRKAFMMIIVVWIWSLVWSVPPIFGWGAYVPEGFQTSCTFDYISREPFMRSYILGLYIAGFVVPLFVIAFCYYLIYKAIKRHDKEMLKMAKKMKVEDIRANQEKTKAEIRIAKIAMMIVCLYLLSWSPYATVALIAQFGPVEWVNPYVSEFPVMLAKAAAMHNPIVYAFSHPKFREALNKRVPWLMCCCDVKPAISPAASRVTNKRGVSRQVSNDSYYGGGNDSDVSSCISQVEDLGQSIEMKKTISETSFTRKHGDLENAIGGAESSNIVRELIHALVNVSNRQQHAVQPPYTPNIPPENNLQANVTEKGVYVVDNGKKIDISTYLAQFVATGAHTKATNPKSDFSNVAVVKTINETGDVKKENKTESQANKETEKTQEKANNIDVNDAENNQEKKNISEACYTNPTYVNDTEEQSKKLDDGHV